MLATNENERIFKGNIWQESQLPGQFSNPHGEGPKDTTPAKK